MISEKISCGDMLNVTDLIGQTFEECGLKREGDFGDEDLEGAFFGIPVKGSARFAPGTEDSTPRMQHASFFVKNSSIDDFYAKLTDRYSGPTDAGEEPYAVANGGARLWYLFDAGNAHINISQGSREDFVRVLITVNPNPGYAGEPVLKRRQEFPLSFYQKKIVMKAERYEKGILTVSITNRSDELFVFTDQYVLAKAHDGGGYVHLNRIRRNVENGEDPTSYEIEQGQNREFPCDLRILGKVEPGRYMLHLDNLKTEFELIPQSEDNGEVLPAPWFCTECGTKNQDTDVCRCCGCAMPPR